MQIHNQNITSKHLMKNFFRLCFTILLRLRLFSDKAIAAIF